MNYIQVYDCDSKQDVAINCEAIIKISSNPLKLKSDSWNTFINTIGNGTVRVADSVEDIIAKIQEVCK